MKDIIVKSKKIGDSQPVFIIAEMAWSHDGSVENARRIIKGAAQAGADAISLHITSMRDYMVGNYGRSVGQGLSARGGKERIYDYLSRMNLEDRDWEKLFSYAKGLNLAVCAMPNDMQSVRLCRKLDPDMYVVAAACFVEENLVSEIAKQGKPVILRIGGATLGEIENTVNLIRKHSGEGIILLHGIQLYPTQLEDTRLRLIPSLKSIFGLPVGLADHVDAESELALMIPIMAIGIGAVVIEKHLTHNRSLRGLDTEAALNPDEFKRFVKYLREAEKALGTAYFDKLSRAGLEYRSVSRKRVVASKRIRKGQRVTRNTIAFKRAPEGIYPDESRFVVGRTVNQDIKENDPITWDKLL